MRMANGPPPGDSPHGGASSGVFAYVLAHPRPRFATAVVNYGDSQSTISATQKLSTVVSIEVGTQVSGSS
jgi:hypothetical protein